VVSAASTSEPNHVLKQYSRLCYFHRFQIRPFSYVGQVAALLALKDSATVRDIFIGFAMRAYSLLLTAIAPSLSPSLT